MVGFLGEKREQDLEFRSEDLQEQINEREAREWQHNQLIIQNQQIQAQQSQAIQVLQQQQAQISALLLQRQYKVVYFKWTVLDFVSEIAFNLFLLLTRKLFNTIKKLLRKLLFSRNFIEKLLQEDFKSLIFF